MKYKKLSPDYKYDVLAQALLAREQEHFHYDFDKQNFEHMLKSLEPGEQRDHIQKMLDSTIREMKKVEAIYAALEAQVTDQKALDAAHARLAAANKQ